MKVIIAGSRTWTGIEKIAMHMNELWDDIGAYTVIVGGAKGADTLGETVALTAGVEVEVYPAEWDKHGKKAGYLRNTVMAGKADYLLAFQAKNSKGTQHMIDIMRELGKPVRVITPTTESPFK